MSAVKPSAAMTACAASWLVARLFLPRTSTASIRPARSRAATTSALVTTGTGRSSTCRTSPSCARNAARRCTMVTERATGANVSAQWKALSPPPTITTSRSRYSSGSGTK